jgi:hypothetical protein
MLEFCQNNRAKVKHPRRKIARRPNPPRRQQTKNKPQRKRVRLSPEHEINRHQNEKVYHSDNH